MTTLDMTQVVGLQAVDAEGNVIGTLSVNDLTELVAKNLVESTQNQVVAARSVSTLSEASTLAASDDYENTLPIDANPASVRTLDADGNPKQTAISSLAQVVGGLIGISKISLNQETQEMDLNTFKHNFGYQIVRNPVNGPIPSGVGVIQCFRLSRSNYFKQIFYSANDIYTRYIINNGESFSDWKKFQLLEV